MTIIINKVNLNNYNSVDELRGFVISEIGRLINNKVLMIEGDWKRDLQTKDLEEEIKEFLLGKFLEIEEDNLEVENIDNLIFNLSVFDQDCIAQVGRTIFNKKKTKLLELHYNKIIEKGDAKSFQQLETEWNNLKEERENYERKKEGFLSNLTKKKELRVQKKAINESLNKLIDDLLNSLESEKNISEYLKSELEKLNNELKRVAETEASLDSLEVLDEGLEVLFEEDRKLKEKNEGIINTLKGDISRLENEVNNFKNILKVEFEKDGELDPEWKDKLVKLKTPEEVLKVENKLANYENGLKDKLGIARDKKLPDDWRVALDQETRKDREKINFQEKLGKIEEKIKVEEKFDFGLRVDWYIIKVKELTKEVEDKEKEINDLRKRILDDYKLNKEVGESKKELVSKEKELNILRGKLEKAWDEGTKQLEECEQQLTDSVQGNNNLLDSIKKVLETKVYEEGMIVKKLEAKVSEKGEKLGEKKNKFEGDLKLLLEMLLKTQNDAIELDNAPYVDESFQILKSSLGKMIDEEELNSICQEQKEISQIRQLIKIFQNKEILSDNLRHRQEAVNIK